ncbi:MFS transporter [Streptomyces sp. NPDC049585]|uniref:MFS transporter n=1 Tax=Streptomyces sp. NPDC049585 TaxID=3155154 RepID=UPI00342FDA0B
MTPIFPRNKYRVTLAGITVNAFGNGLMSPYVISWLAALPHASTQTAGIVFGATGAGQLIATLYAGRLLTALSPRNVLATGLSLSAAAAALLTAAHGLALAAAVLFALGSAQGIASAAQATALGTVKFADGNEDRVWSHLQVVLNVGQGSGFLLGGYLVTGNLVQTMRPVFLLNAISFAFFAAVVLLALPRHPASPNRRGQAADGSYRTLLSQRHARHLILGDATFFTFGIGFLLLLPLLASEADLLTLHQVALLLAVNTLIIVCGQLAVTRLARRIPRATGMRLLFLGAAASWVLIAAATELHSQTGSLIAVWSAVVLFSVVECLHTACLVPQLREAVPQADRPRILALHVFASKAGLIAGPALGGIAIAANIPLTWAAASCLLLGPALFSYSPTKTTAELPQKTPV